MLKCFLSNIHSNFAVIILPSDIWQLVDDLFHAVRYSHITIKQKVKL